MNELFMDFLTILLPTYFFLYMAITLIHRNKRSMLNRIAAFLMLAFLFYFLGEYIKTSLLPEYQMQIVLYGNAPMLLFVICFLVHLCILMGDSTTEYLKRRLPIIYAAPFTLWLIFLVTMEHTQLYNVEVTDGRSPLDPLFLLLTLLFVAGYILLSAVILSMIWYRTKEKRVRKASRSLLLGLFSLFAWFVMVTLLLQSMLITTRYSMILYFVGYLMWAVILRHQIGKYNIMPDYRKLFHILFKSAPTAIMLLDRKGTVRELNPKAKHWFEGIPIQEIPQSIEFNNGISLHDVLASLEERREGASHWEIRVDRDRMKHVDLIMNLELVEGANEELFVMHLTDVTSLKNTERRLLESEQEYKHLALHDSLTNLSNRAAMEEYLEQKIAQQERFALVLIDLDNFKPVNDSYGHLVGDLYLKHIARIFKNTAGPSDLAARIGGDEFVLIVSCADKTDTEVIEMIHDRLSSLSMHSFRYENTEIAISYSSGVSIYPRDASNVTQLLKIADEAMYKEKRTGRALFTAKL
ncbi:diguanylate cyclase (GGDEF) domain-containing protein [Paenibacillus sp. 453mf]|nr:diguanylate cyclase (GGDEF) domain-containing protein [Paenibacillus sp. 453mf]